MSNVPNQQYPHQPKKRRTWPWITLAVIAGVIAISLAANSGQAKDPTGAPAGNEASAPGGAEDVKSNENVIVYEVTGTGIASSITYTTDGETTINQETNVALPWKKTIKLPTGEPFQMVSLTAQGSADAAKINVVITVNGKVVKQAHATGYGVASADENIGALG